MKEFNKPVGVDVTEINYNRDFKERLKRMGYKNTSSIKFCDGGVLVTNITGKVGVLGMSHMPTTDSNRIILKSYQPDLFLALAAMNSNKDGGYGEYYKAVNDPSGVFGNGSIVRMVKQSLDDECVFEVPKLSAGKDGLRTRNHKSFVKLSEDEIIEHFKNPNLITTPKWNMINKWANEFKVFEIGHIKVKFKLSTGDDGDFNPQFITYNRNQRVGSYKIPKSKIGLCSLPTGTWEILRSCLMQQYNKIKINK